MKKAPGMTRANNVGELTAKITEFEEHIRQYAELFGKPFDSDIKAQRLHDFMLVEAERPLLLERKAGEVPEYNKLLSRIMKWAQLNTSGHVPMDTLSFELSPAAQALKKELDQTNANFYQHVQ